MRGTFQHIHLLQTKQPFWSNEYRIWCRMSKSKLELHSSHFTWTALLIFGHLWVVRDVLEANWSDIYSVVVATWTISIIVALGGSAGHLFPHAPPQLLLWCGWCAPPHPRITVCIEAADHVEQSLLVNLHSSVPGRVVVCEEVGEEVDHDNATLLSHHL